MTVVQAQSRPTVPASSPLEPGEAFSTALQRLCASPDPVTVEQVLQRTYLALQQDSGLDAFRTYGPCRGVRKCTSCLIQASALNPETLSEALQQLCASPQSRCLQPPHRAHRRCTVLFTAAQLIVHNFARWARLSAPGAQPADYATLISTSARQTTF